MNKRIMGKILGNSGKNIYIIGKISSIIGTGFNTSKLSYIVNIVSPVTPVLSYQVFLKGQCWGHFSSPAV